MQEGCTWSAEAACAMLIIVQNFERSGSPVWVYGKFLYRSPVDWHWKRRGVLKGRHIERLHKVHANGRSARRAQAHSGGQS